MKYVIPQIPNVTSHNALKYFMKGYSYICNCFLCNNNIMIVFTSIAQLSKENIVASVTSLLAHAVAQPNIDFLPKKLNQLNISVTGLAFT